jgi:hypothetical protein
MNKLLALFIIVFLLISGNAVIAQQIRLDDIEKDQKRIGISIGYGQNHKFPAATKDHFKFAAIKLSFGKRISPRVENLFDISYSQLTEERENSSLSLTVGHRRYFKVTPTTAFGIELNIGIMTMKHRVHEQGSGNNFTEQLGLVYDYVVSEKNTVSLEYIFSHISNAGIKLPNVGINTSIVSLGYNWYY